MYEFFVTVSLKPNICTHKILCDVIMPRYILISVHIRVPDFEVIYVSHDDVIKWKHFPRYWSFVRGIHCSPVIFPHKGQCLMFYLIWAWTNDWVNNQGACDLRRHRAQDDVIVMHWFFPSCVSEMLWMGRFACKLYSGKEFSINFLSLFMFLYITQVLHMYYFSSQRIFILKYLFILITYILYAVIFHKHSPDTFLSNAYIGLMNSVY